MSLQITTLDERPWLAPAMWQAGARIWPRFMLNDPVADGYYGRIEDDFPHWTLVATDGDAVVAKAHVVPFALGGDELPARGWDAVIERGLALHDDGGTPDVVSALEVGIVPERRGSGLSTVMLSAMRDHVADLGFADLYAPVRPSQKADQPFRVMDDYAFATREDGLPIDAWLRVHVRLGAHIVTVCPESMTIPGSLEQWREWTGAPFDADGAQVVDGALAPVQVDTGAGTAVYVEPNVWVHHRL